MSWLLIHGIIAPVVVGLPLFVVLIALTIVKRDSAVARRSFVFRWSDLAPLSVVTVIAWAAVAVWLVADAGGIAAGTRGRFLGIAEIGIPLSIFWIFAAPLLGKIDKAARASVQEQIAGGDSQYRAASLRPRKLSNYLPLPLRVPGMLICVITLAYLIGQISVASPGLRLTMPIGYGAIAVIFFFLYEVWIRGEALGAQALGSGNTSGPTAEEAEWTRRRRVRQIFFLQITLTLFFSMMALVAIGIRWESPTGSTIGALTAVAGVLVGGVGCAFALSSDMGDRYLRLAVHRSDDARLVDRA